MTSFSGWHDDLSSESERLKGNKQIVSKLKQFHSLSTHPNQTKIKMLQTDKPNIAQFKKVYGSVKQYEETQQRVNLSDMKSRKVYEAERKIPIKQELQFFGRIVKYFIVIFVVMFLIDFYYELQNQIELKTNQISKCYQDYIENNCSTPLDALIEECSRLEFCASRDPKSIAKFSNVFIKTVLGIIGIIISHLSLTGIIFVILIIALYLNRPTMYQEERIYKYE